VGASAPFIQVPLVTRVQQEVGSGIQGRVFATLSTVSTASVPLGAALAGSALSILQPQLVFRVVTIGLVTIYAVLMLYQAASRTRGQMSISK